jgi:hypothetical protein
MQAKKVFEVQNFQRGQSPKKALDLGGMILGKESEKRLEDLKERKREAEIHANQDWDMFLQETLAGKKITAKMTSMPHFKVKPDGGIGEQVGKRETKEFTITVQDIQSDDLSELLLSVVIADMDNKMYNLHLSDKIYFE